MSRITEAFNSINPRLMKVDLNPSLIKTVASKFPTVDLPKMPTQPTLDDLVKPTVLPKPDFPLKPKLPGPLVPDFPLKPKLPGPLVPDLPWAPSPSDPTPDDPAPAPAPEPSPDPEPAPTPDAPSSGVGPGSLPSPSDPPAPTQGVPTGPSSPAPAPAPQPKFIPIPIPSFRPNGGITVNPMFIMAVIAFVLVMFFMLQSK